MYGRLHVPIPQPRMEQRKNVLDARKCLAQMTTSLLATRTGTKRASYALHVVRRQIHTGICLEKF